MPLQVSSLDLFEPTGGLVIRSPLDESQLIANVGQWFRFAQPLGGARHWKDGRSAKEVAKAWCSARLFPLGATSRGRVVTCIRSRRRDPGSARTGAAKDHRQRRWRHRPGRPVLAPCCLDRERFRAAVVEFLVVGVEELDLDLESALSLGELGPDLAGSAGAAVVRGQAESELPP
jgi:hypothetical protein